MNINIIMYFAFGIVSIAGALILIFSKHPVRSALGLLTTMLALAGMYAILHAYSIAVFQVIIYGGAVMVLIIYFIMLLDIKSEDYGRPFSALLWVGAPLILIVSLLFIFKLITALALNGNSIAALNTSGVAVSEEFGGIRNFSTQLLTKYLFAFEYVSTLLFAAIVAVIAIVQLDWKGRKNE